MQLGRGHLVVVVAGVLLIASSFVPLWATYRVPGLGLVAPETSHQNAWTAYGLTMQLALGSAVAATALAAARLARLRAAVRRGGTALLALCAVTVAMLVWQVIRGPQGSSDPGGYGIDRGLLLFTGTALAACMTYGSHLARREIAPPAAASEMMSAGERD
ncbi:MAG TPA: hypothetical protein VHN37_06600 [Actinomycetota bacterium]|nr:hypothetical protein [Actinomycetota bacterium]